MRVPTATRPVATLSDAVTVNHSQVGQLSLELILPSALREGQNGTVTVEYANTGDTDIAAPMINLTTTQATFNNSEPGGDLLTSVLAWSPQRPSFSALDDDDSDPTLPVTPFLLTPGVMDVLTKVAPSHG